MRTSPDATQTVRAFFDAYRLAFETRDGPAVVERFAFPTHVTADSGEIALTLIPDRLSCLETIERLFAMYEAIDVASGQVVDLSVTELSPRLFAAEVHWSLSDGKGRELYGFDAAYTLARFRDGLRITAIAHDELPRYRECVARLEGG